jgi:cell volume regulation protein A
MSDAQPFASLVLVTVTAVLLRPDVWVSGLLVGVAPAVVIRPVVVGLCLLRARLSDPELVSVLFAGLRGAVPILLGGFLLALHLADAPSLYGIMVRGSMVPTVARRLKLPMRAVEPAGAPAEGRTIAELADLPGDAWVNLILRDPQLLSVTGSADCDRRAELAATFEGLAPPTTR